ncbi:hypothetical protein AXF42_Ash019435 [Apostasia shenzhenica]|uniref:Methyltransferase-like protein 17, mitochondrial n=1 Tax=Apostasia shenzhenica TaxID=1088818 RepID=A0A2I0B500_9ASPA|nr:hypothetical protein AXF42_Ash019435 [Apostasia shenzhenica]
MASATVPEAATKLLTAEAIRAAAKQSEGIHLVPLSLRRAIKKFLRERKMDHMTRKVMYLSQSFNQIKDTNLQIAASASRELVEDPFRPVEHGGARWKIRSAYGDIGLKYTEDETVAYIASRMPSVYSACHRVLREVRRRLPELSLSRVLDFGAGPGSALWAVREVWPRSLERINLVEPSKEMQRAAQSLLRGEICSDEKGIVLKGLLRNGAFVVAPCSHDGRCPLENTSKYCHFVQRLERTSSQRAYKLAFVELLLLQRSKGEPLRGFEDEKFCFVALRRGKRPQEAWPLDGMNFETLKEKLAKRKPEDLIIDFEDQFEREASEDKSPYDQEDEENSYASDASEITLFNENDDDDEDDDKQGRADLGGGWARILYTPVRRGKRVAVDVCRSAKRDASEGTFERIIVTRRESPELHLQARRSLWGDLWPF